MRKVKILMLVMLAVGVFFRFANIDRKIYWHDECLTSLRSFGYTRTEVIQHLFNGKEIGTEDLRKYQHLNPEKGLVDTINSLAGNAEHSPLYYVIVRFWAQWFGNFANSIIVTRSLSALLSLLAFPCLYWLCQELFGSLLTGYIAIILFAVSPFQVVYAQEAREYSLWTVTVLLSSAALLKAIRLKTRLNWGLYVATVVLGLYSSVLSGLVTIAHGIYVVAIEKFRLTKTVTAYLLVCLVSFVAFVPWILVIISHWHALRTVTSWTATDIPLSDLIKIWFINIRIIVFDLNLAYRDDFFIYFIIPIFSVLIMVGYSIFFLCKKSPKKTWYFLLIFAGVPALALMLPDLLLGGQRSISPRYLIPSYLGFQLAIANLFATQIKSASFSRQKIWKVMMALVILAGVLSCVTMVSAQTWWTKDNYGTDKNHQIARVINQAIPSTIISNSIGSNVGNLLSLSYLLEPKVRFRLVVESNTPQIPDICHNNVFLFGKHLETLRLKIEQEKKYNVKQVLDRLWQLGNYENFSC